MKLLLGLLAMTGSAFSFADCADVSMNLYGIEMGGARSYVEELPTGLTHVGRVAQAWEADGKELGRDAISGEAEGMKHEAGIYWYEGRVALIADTMKADSESARDAYLDTIAGIANREFVFHQNASEYHFQCEPEISITAVKSGIGSINGPVQVLILGITHSLYSEMQDAIQSP